MLKWWKSKTLEWELKALESQNKIAEAQKRKLELAYSMEAKEKELERNKAILSRPDTLMLDFAEDMDKPLQQRAYYNSHEACMGSAKKFAISQMKIHGYKDYEFVGNSVRCQEKHFPDMKVVLKNPITNPLQTVIRIEDSVLGTVVYDDDEDADKEIAKYLESLCEAEGYSFSKSSFVGIKVNTKLGEEKRVKLYGYLSLIKSEEKENNKILLIE